MGRRDDEREASGIPEEVKAGLDELFEAFSGLRFPNPAMLSLADLALAEYRLAERSIDRKHWHGQLLAVARVCQEFDTGKRDDKPSGDGLEIVHHNEGGHERGPEGDGDE